MRVVVVGCGAVGAASALALARAGHDVTVLERFGAANAQGSSHGAARIFRTSYDIADYTELAVRSLSRWRAIEAEAGVTLLTTTGCVDHGDGSALAAITEATGAGGGEVVEVPRAEAASRWPGLRFASDVVLDPLGGRLDANTAVQAMTRLAVAHGAKLRRERVLDVEAGAVVTESATHHADVTVVAAGAWSTKLVGGLPRQTVTLEQPLHLAAPPAGWPSFIHHVEPFVYGLYEPGAGLKVGEHATGRVVDPDDPDRTPDADRVARLREYCSEWIPGADASTARATGCLYDTTATHDPVVDRTSDGIVVACGTSGHGFKFAPELGALVREVAEGGGPHPRFSIPER